MANNLSKEICTFLVFFKYTSGYLKFCKTFCIFEMAWSRAFQKWIIFHFLDKFFFANIFTIKLDFALKNSIFANLQVVLQILKVEHKSFLMMYHLSYLDIKHGYLEGGGQIDPNPQHILVFKYPSRDRVKNAQLLC